MKIQTIITGALYESTIKLTDLYDEDELNDETEELYHFLDDGDLDIDFEIKIMSPKEAKTYVTSKNDTTVYQSYLDHATKEQKSLVKNKAKRYDDSRIIVTMNKTVIDGNHQLVAGILANRDIKYINLAQ